jgi:hypothetical protein
MTPGFGGGGGSSGVASGVTGVSSAQDTTGVPSVTLTYAPSAVQPPRDVSRPRIGFLVLSPRAFTAANSGPSAVAAEIVGARVFFTLSEAARVTFTVERPTRGIRRGRSCVSRPKGPQPRAKPCIRYAGMRGGFAQQGVAGLNGFRFMGRLRGRSLPRGDYRLVASARDPAGNASIPARRPFRIIGG